MDDKPSDASLIDIGNIRLLAVRKLPYLAYWGTALIPVRAAIPGLWMAVDRYGRLYYNRDTMTKHSMLHNMLVFLHETLHLVLQHPHTLEKVLSVHEGTSEHTRYYACAQIAGDFVVDSILVDEDIGVADDTYREHALLPDKYGLPPKLTMLQYYQLLCDIKDNPQRLESTFPAANKEKLEELIEKVSQVISYWENVDGNTASRSVPKDGAVGSSGVCDISPRPWQMGPVQDDGRPVYPEDAPGISKTRQERLTIATKEAARADHARRGRGSVPAEFLRLVDQATEPVVNPFDFLSAVVRQRMELSGVGPTPDYNVPRRRLTPVSDPDLLMPRFRKPIPRVAVIVDTSGSMSRSDLELAMGAIQYGLRSRRELDLYSADVGVNSAQQIRSISDVRFTGGGGTDMGKAIEDVLKQRHYHQIVVITDGYTGWCAKPPKRTDVVVAIVPGGSESSVPHWATTVRLDAAAV